VSWWDDVRVLDAQGRADDAMNLLYDFINTQLYDGLFHEVDLWLDGVEVDRCSTGLLIDALIMTLAARDRLEARSRFVARCRRVFEIRRPYDDDVDEVMRGLE
jgi:hypothetical protein